MSTSLQIRAEAAPAILEQAERALAVVTTPDEAEDVFRKLTALEQAARIARLHAETQLRVGKLKLRAERRWGELLGPAENRGPATVTGGHGSTDADRTARKRAREVAAVEEDIFERYLATVRDEERLRRARLLRLQREWEASQRTAEAEVYAIGDVEIRLGNLRTALDDLAGQVDAIITDPPYPAEYLNEYDALGEVAARILKPNGVVAVMVGQTHLPEYLARLGKHLTYRWTCAYLTDGPAARVFGRNVGTKWKPVLLFGGDEFLTQDVFRSRADDKGHHEWGQSESGMADIVSRLTAQGDLVVDPFLGGGTTAVVCRDLGRRFVGCDIDGKAIASSTKRLS